jgi:hypothetical protein
VLGPRALVVEVASGNGVGGVGGRADTIGGVRVVQATRGRVVGVLVAAYLGAEHSTASRTRIRTQACAGAGARRASFTLQA